ncbi:MAG: DUF6090 family protein [Allomuricauda sp.]
MIKFFRKIRQNLLSEGKTGKYLKYAIGEIILVVIGILIALQINNWNNDRIESKIETNILKEIVVNLKKDVVNLNSKIRFNLEKEKSNKEVLTHLKHKTPITDSLKLYYGSLLGRGNFEPITVAYENLKTRGVDIIKNDSLRIAISELYDFKYYYVTEDLRRDYEIVREFHESQIHLNIKTTYKDGRLFGEPHNLTDVQSNFYFQEALTQAILFYRYMNRIFQNGIKENEELQKQIKNELIQK